MYSHSYKVVCYQCSYEGQGPATRCPVCHFPVILEPENTPPGGRRLAEIFSRPSVQGDAPPLPGVDPQKRKAQLMAEARRARLAQRNAGRVPIPQLAPPTPPPAHRGWMAAAKVTFLCASAIVAGVIAAVLQSSAL